MALSAGLQLRQRQSISQSLVMTPQLMQSIRLLQFTHAELIAFVEQEIERNPLLEPLGTPSGSDGDGHAGDDGAGFDAGPAGGPDADGSTGDDGPAAADRTETGRMEGGAGEALDPAYENVYPDDVAPAAGELPALAGQWKSMPGAGAGGREPPDLDAFAARQPTLRDHVAEQIAFAGLSPQDRAIATELADHLDPAGYLGADTADIAAQLAVAESRVEAVLAHLQTFDPPGLFARSLSECLALQLRRKDRFDPAMAAIVDHLELLARRDFAALKRLSGVGEDDLIDMLAEIRALDPKPGSRFETGFSEAIVPDVTVRAAPDGGWLVELNPETLPRVLVDQTYHARVSAAAGTRPEDRAFLAECLQSANWLTRSLDQRARTIVKVASEIVRRQDGFFVGGVSQLRPLTLRMVADAIGMHESTVSRVTSNKYMLTPRGVFEFKYFFTVPIAATAGGEAHSAEAVRHRIRAMVAAERDEAVLSDDDIVAALKQDGIDIARRTVAKYRDALGIASSVQRRRERRARLKAAAS